MLAFILCQFLASALGGRLPDGNTIGKLGFRLTALYCQELVDRDGSARVALTAQDLA